MPTPPGDPGCPGPGDQCLSRHLLALASSHPGLCPQHSFGAAPPRLLLSPGPRGLYIVGPRTLRPSVRLGLASIAATRNSAPWSHRASCSPSLPGFSLPMVHFPTRSASSPPAPFLSASFLPLGAFFSGQVLYAPGCFQKSLSRSLPGSRGLDQVLALVLAPAPAPSTRPCHA